MHLSAAPRWLWFCANREGAVVVGCLAALSRSLRRPAPQRALEFHPHERTS
jgi:hypothetical protein